VGSTSEELNQGPDTAALKPEKPSGTLVVVGMVLQRKLRSKFFNLPGTLRLIHPFRYEPSTNLLVPIQLIFAIYSLGSYFGLYLMWRSHGTTLESVLAEASQE
jgi:hypothetical protein